jgi:tetratricopeptide (TPR) repeat protein
MDFLKSISVIIITTISFFNAGAQNDKITDAFGQSYVYEKNADYAKAIQAIKNVYNENSYEMNLRLGWLNYYSAKYTESVVYYTKATNLQPKSIEAMSGLVLPLVAEYKSDDALKIYKRILELDPQNSYALYKTGAIYYYKQDYQTAFTYLEKGITMYPFDYDYNYLLAWTYYKLGKKSEAKPYFQRALLNRPTDVYAKEGLEMIKE